MNLSSQSDQNDFQPHNDLFIYEQNTHFYWLPEAEWIHKTLHDTDIIMMSQECLNYTLMKELIWNYFCFFIFYSGWQ